MYTEEDSGSVYMEEDSGSVYMEEEKGTTRFPDPEECDNESAIFGASLSPPALPALNDANYRAAHPPSWVLLDVSAYIAEGYDADATAKSKTRGGHAIEVTLIAAHPPLVSHICVNCPGLKPTRFATEPRIFAAADGLFLLGVVIGHQLLSTQPEMFDYFIYQPAAQSLTLLPHSDGHFGLRDVALLRCNPGNTSRPRQITLQPDYVIAFLEGTRGMSYELHRFHSKTNTWTKNKLELGAMNYSLDSVVFRTSKVFTLGSGGGFIGWADLWRGILLCDVFLEDPELHYVPLPHSFSERKWDAIISRDIALVDQGYIKYVDKQPDDHSIHGWTFTSWSKKIIGKPWNEGDWHQEYEFSAFDISALPPLPKPVHMLVTGHPVISLRGDDVVYLMIKESLKDDKAWLAAVNIRSKSLQEVVEFGGAARSIGISRTYVQSRISGHPKITPGTVKRPGMLLTGSLSKRLALKPFWKSIPERDNLQW